MSVTPETDEERAGKKLARDMITLAKVHIHEAQPFYGRLVEDLDEVEASWVKTAATNGIKLFYNWRYVISLTRRQLRFLIKHELFHILLDHIGRRGNRDEKCWNAAIDYLINWDLLEEEGVDLKNGYTKKGIMMWDVMPPNGCFDIRFNPNEMSSEQLYDYLWANRDTIVLPPPMDQHFNSVEDGSGEGANGDETPEEGSSSESDGQAGEHTKRFKLTPDEMRQKNERVQEAVIQAAALAQFGGKDIPASLRHLVKKIVSPQIDWRGLLDAYMRSRIKANRTFMRPSRRSFAATLSSGGRSYIPLSVSNTDRTVKVTIALDVSASITEEILNDLFTEVVSISKTFPQAEIEVFAFHEAVVGYRKYTSETVDDLVNYEIPKETGGTLFESIFSFLKEKEITPERLVVFTDGKPSLGWGDPDYCPTLFIIHGDVRQRIKPPYGQVAYYEKKNRPDLYSHAA